MVAPVAAEPGVAVTVRYLTDVTWDRLTYTVVRDGEVVRRGAIRGREASFRLPDAPGEYTVTFRYTWGGPLAGTRGEGVWQFVVRL